MAQFKSSAREGSFSNNQLVAPDTSKNIQLERDRIASGLRTAQDWMAGNRAIALQAQKQAQTSVQAGLDAAIRENKSAGLRVANATEKAYAVQLQKQQNEDKYKIDTFGALADFSKLAFDTTNQIIQNNKDNQLKAVNQIAFKFKVTHEDLINAKSVNQDISRAAWQETQVYRDYLEEGKSVEFLNMMYDHQIKGGGYINYIENANVLREQATINGREINRIANDPNLTPDQKRTQIDAKDAQMRGALAIGPNGKIPGKEVLSGYNAAMQRHLDRAETVINKDVTVKATEKYQRDQASILLKEAFGGGTFNPGAALQTATVSTRPNAMPDAVNMLIQHGLSLDELDKLPHATYQQDGKVTTLNESSPESIALINQAKQRETQRIQSVINAEAAEKQLMAEMSTNALAQELATDDGLLSNEDYRKVEANYYEEAGYGADSRFLQGIKRQTAEVQLIPLMREQLEEMRLNGTLSMEQLDRIAPPKQLYDQYSGAALKLDQARATPKYKELNSILEGRIVGAIKEVKAIGYKNIGGQSDQFNWFVGTQVTKNKKKILDLVATGTPMEEAIDKIGNSAAIEAKAYLMRPDVFDGVTFKPYEAVMAASTKAQYVAQKRVTAFKRFKTREEQKDPSNWLSAIGETLLVEASKRLAEKGTSEVLNVIAQRTGMTAYEVQHKLAEVSENIEPIEINKTYEQIQNAWSAEQRYAFTSNQASDEQRLRTLQQQTNQLENRNSYRTRETFQTESFTHNGSAGDQLVDKIIGGEGGYESVNKGRAGDTPGGHPGLSNLSIGEVMALQKTTYNAVGAPQFIGTTLPIAMRDAGLTEQDTFSPENQRAMAVALMIGTKQPALSAYINGRSDNLDAAHQAIANEWASIQGPSGAGSYDGDGAGNFAHTDGNEIRQLLVQMRAEMLGE